MIHYKELVKKNINSLALEFFIFLQKSFGSNLELIVLLVHRVEGGLQVLHLLVVHALHVRDLSRLVRLKSLDLVNQLRVLLLQLTDSVNVA